MLRKITYKDSLLALSICAPAIFLFCISKLDGYFFEPLSDYTFRRLLCFSFLISSIGLFVFRQKKHLLAQILIIIGIIICIWMSLLSLAIPKCIAYKTMPIVNFFPAPNTLSTQKDSCF